MIIISAVLAATLMRPASNSFTIPGTEAQRTIERLQSEFPGSGGASATVVFAAPEGQTIAPYLPLIAKTGQELAQLPAVANVTDLSQTTPQTGELPRIVILPVTLKDKTGEVTEETAAAVNGVLSGNRQNGLQIEATGLASQAPGEILGVGEIVGVIVAALVLIITFGSLVAAGMPLVIAIVGIAIGAALIYAVGGVVDITATTPVLAIMLGLAVGIDYALFIISRYRQYLLEGLSPETAVGRASSTAGNAVVFAALTVIIALSALSVVGIPFLTSMGLAAAGTVAIIAIIAVTLLPALLGFAGNRILPKNRRNIAAVGATKQPVSKLISKWGWFTTSRPWVALLVPVIALAIVAIPTASLRIGLPDAASSDPTSSERKAYDLISQGYGPGFNAPLIVVVDLPTGSTQQSLLPIAQRIGQYAPMAIPAQVNQAGTVGIIQVIPKEGPTAESTTDLVNQLRDNKQTILSNAGTDLAVTGNTALAIDVDAKLAAALPVYLAVVVGLSIILLVIVFRSILVPIKATLGFLLSVGAAFGSVVAIFQWGWFGWFEPSLIISFLPILMVGILFGLAMDYQFFLVSSMHEAYAHEKFDAKRAVRLGFERGAPVVTAAALIMTSVFGGFIFSHDNIIRMIGFGLAIGVFVDAFIVRMTIVPAVMTLFGKAAWWIPKWLEKVLPNVTIEGK